MTFSSERDLARGSQCERELRTAYASGKDRPYSSDKNKLHAQYARRLGIRPAAVTSISAPASEFGQPRTIITTLVYTAVAHV